MVKTIDTIVNLKEWYSNNKVFYEGLAKNVANILEDLITENNIDFHSVTSRAKEEDSFINKAKKDKYTDPKNQIHDLSGIRVICFVKSDVIKVCKLIESLFEIDEENSVNKEEELGDEKVGYRSVHYVAKLGDDRLKLTEYRKYEGLCFEIQVRTILEHAWADISHDRTYKFNGVLPNFNSIKRRFSLAAASLELVDREFDNLAREIEIYANKVEEDINSGQVYQEINGTSLSAYLNKKFIQQIRKGKLDETFGKGENTVIEELKAMDIINLGELDKIISQINPDNDLDKLIVYENNFIGLLRDIMVIYNANDYFEKAWNSSWESLDEKTRELYMKYNVNIDKFIRKYKLTLIPYLGD